MAIALVTGAHASAIASTNTSAIDDTGANFIVSGGVFHNDKVISNVDSKSNTWNALTRSAGTNVASQLAYAQAALVGSGHTFQDGAGAGSVSGTSWASFSGLDPVPFIAENGAVDNASPLLIQAGSVTPLAAGDLIVCHLGVESLISGVGITGGGTWTIVESILAAGATNWGGYFAYLIATSGSAVNPTWAWTGASRAVARIAAFKKGASVVPTKVAVTVQPSACLTQRAFSPAIAVSITDNSGFVDTTNTSNVTASLNVLSGIAQLQGTATIAAIAGVATFSNLNVLASDGAVFTITFSDGALTPATTTSITNAVRSNDNTTTCS